MYQQRRSTSLAKYVLFLVGLFNLALGLYLLITKDRSALLIAEADIKTNMQLFTYLLSFLGIVLIINGTYNLIISLKHQNLVFIAALLEFIKAGAVLYLEYIHKLSGTSLPRIIMAITVLALTLIVMILAIRSRFSKKYIFFDN